LAVTVVDTDMDFLGSRRSGQQSRACLRRDAAEGL
jgi:hypothetical protein